MGITMLRGKKQIVLTLSSVFAITSAAFSTPDLETVPNPLNFGTVRVGDLVGPEILTVSNMGDTDLVISKMVLRGRDVECFSIDSAITTCNFSGMTLAPGSSCQIGVLFHPDAATYKMASIRIVSNDPDEGNFYTNLRGYGAAPDIEITPTSIDFGNVWMGHPVSQNINVQNTGNYILLIKKILIGGKESANFSIISENCSTISPLAPGESCNITVQFNPTIVGIIDKASVRIVSDDVDDPRFYVHLRGIGRSENEPDIASTPRPLNFGHVAVGSPEPGTVYFYNESEAGNGAIPLQIEKIILRGRDKDQFRITADNCTGVSLYPGENCSVDVEFTPTSEGYKRASVRAVSNDPDPIESPYDSNVEGVGISEF